MRTPEGQAQTVEINPFWSDRVRGEALGSGVQKQAQADGGQGTPANADRLVAHDGLSHQDLLEIEAMKMQALREVQEKLNNEMARRRGVTASGNSGGSYRTADGVGLSPSHPPGLAVTGTPGVGQPLMFTGTPGCSLW